MTIKDYIKNKFKDFGIKLSESNLFDIWPGDDDTITTENKEEVEIAIAGFIPQLLLRPESVAEGGYKISFDQRGIKDYYAFLCNKYGLEDLINDISTISDGSNLW